MICGHYTEISWVIIIIMVIFLLLDMVLVSICIFRRTCGMSSHFYYFWVHWITWYTQIIFPDKWKGKMALLFYSSDFQAFLFIKKDHGYNKKINLAIVGHEMAWGLLGMMRQRIPHMFHALYLAKELYSCFILVLERTSLREGALVHCFLCTAMSYLMLLYS